MVSYFEQGLKKTDVTKDISVDELINMIRDHPKKDSILRLRSLNYGCEAYNLQKQKLPCITPHGTFNKRNNRDLRELSGLIYFDIDATDIDCSINEFKRYMINAYPDNLYIIGTSVGGKGIFFYVKVNVENIHVDSFSDLQSFIIESHFTGLPIDRNAKGLCQPQIIPYDPDLIVNDNAIEIDLSNYKEYSVSNKKSTSQYISLGTGEQYKLTCTFLSVAELLKDIKWKTEVEVNDPVVEIKEIDFVQLYIPKHIPDGKKHRTFTRIINQLMYLNPGINLFKVLSFINWVNSTRTGDQPMDPKKMINYVTFIYKRIIETGEIYIQTKKKGIHFHKHCGKSGEEKRDIAAKINGNLRKEESIRKMKDAVTDLQSQHKKITQKNVSTISGLHVNTVKNYWKEI